MHDPYRALYLHVPFCKQRCRYCDFATRAVAPDAPELDAYVEQLVLDIRRAAKRGDLAAIETVYFGGGTPTYLGHARLTELLYALSLSMHLTPEVECTVEANPDSLDERLVRDLWALGANRISIGVQSFDDDVLACLGRVHDARRAREAVRTAQERFENVSVDLMCGIPGQSAESLRAGIEEAVALGVTHVSIYPLAVEAGTAFDMLVKAGEMEPVDDDAQADQMEAAAGLLEAAGFARYEVASFARPGFESRHNTAYWTGVPYLGLGPHAATMTQDATRRMRMQDGRVTDDLDARQMAAEDLMLGMRLVRGVPDGQVARAAEALPAAPAVLEDLRARGLAVHDEGRWRPTKRGWLCGNELFGALLDLAP